MATWLIIALPVLLFLVGLAIWSIRIHAGSAFQWVTAPLRNDAHTFLSLSRLLLVGVIVVGQTPAMFHDWFWKYGGAALCVVEVIAFFADITTSKTAAAVLTILAGKNGVSVAGVPGITAAAPAAASPDGANPVPDPEPTAKVPDDAPEAAE